MVEIFKENDASYRFVMKSPSGGTLLNSIEFKSRDAVRQTILQLGDLIKQATTIERRTNHNGKFQFNLKDKTGKIIGQSLLYNSEAGMENGIKNLGQSVSSVKNL